MNRSFLLPALLVISISVFGQSGYRPVFKTKADSIQYQKITAARLVLSQAAIGDYEGSARRIAYDSLNKIEAALRERITWLRVYKPQAHFTPFADLQAGRVNPDSVIRLSISGLRADQIPREVFLCKNLEELELVNTRIDELQDGLNALTKLSSVYLFNNVPSGRLILGKNSNVNYLRIAGNHPEKLPRTYKNFSSLDSLNINRSMATRLPNLTQNKQLTIVNAVENNITLKRFRKSSTLEHLDLRRNQVTKVPNSIARKYSNLKALSLNTNPVKKVKPGLGRLNKLEYLSLYGNMLTEIPEPVYNLASLQVIDLFHNRIESVSPKIKNMQQLKVFYAANNRLYNLPEEIGQLKNLEEVYVYNNRMDTLPVSMNELEKLRILWVNDNFFHTIPAAVWRVKNMDYLDASQNYIKQVPEEIVQAGKLTVLVLSETLMRKEHHNPELFKRLRDQGTRIIYYRAATDPQEEEREF